MCFKCNVYFVCGNLEQLLIGIAEIYEFVIMTAANT